jgi:pimeloyl-ACP methyl ester carboxylesterase
VYAALFPERVRAMALDAAWDPVEDTAIDAWTTEFGGFEHALNRWIAWCQADTTCDLHGPDVGAQWDAIYELLDEQPIRTAAGTIIDGSAVQTASYNAMYANWMWPILARGLADAAFGNGDVLEEILGEGDATDSLVHRATDDPEGAAMMAIRCASGIDLPRPDDPAATLAAVQAAAPRMSRGEGLSMFSEPDVCDAIIGADVVPIVPVYAGAGPIVVIGGQNDPATPFRYAVEMSARLGPNTALLTYTGEGHAFLGSSSCVTGHISGVLRDGVLPPAGSVCDADPPVARPAFWDTMPIVAGVGDPVDAAVDYALPDAYGPWQAYADVRVLTGDPEAVFAAYKSALGAAGFADLGTYDYDVGWAGVDFRAPDGTPIFVDVMTAEYVADIAFVNLLVPAGSGLVVIGAYGTDPYAP